jgi:hypothetical protein
MNVKQEELLRTYLSEMTQDLRPVYRELAVFLSGLGYLPKKEKNNLSFKHALHNKQIAKMGFGRGQKASPFFALRFSACRGYSDRFADIVRANILKFPHKTPGCLSNTCHFCAGEPETHTYACTFSGGETKRHCGAYALNIPELSAKDLEELKKLIAEEHAYLILHEAQDKAAKIGGAS